MRKIVKPKSRTITASSSTPREIQYKLEDIIESYGVVINDFAEDLMAYFSADEVIDALKYYCRVYLDIDGDELEAMLED